MPKFLDVTDVAVAKGYLGVDEFAVTSYGANGDGTTDDTTAIHAARDAAGVGRRVVFPAGTYLVDGLAASVSDQVWELHPGAVIKMKIGASEVLTVSGDNVTVVGGTFDCSNGTENDWSQQGIRVSGDDFTLRNSTVRDSPKIGVYALNCDRTAVSGCTFIDNYDAAVFIQNSQDAPSDTTGHMIANNSVVTSSVRGTGFGVRGESTTRTVSKVTVTGNQVVLSAAPSTVDPSGLALISGVDCVVADNIFEGGSFGITAPDAIRATLSGNIIRGFHKIGIELPGICSNTTVTGNIIDVDSAVDSGYVSSGDTGIIFSDGSVTNVTITGNTISGFSEDSSEGIAFSTNSNPDGVVVSGNTITSTTDTFSAIYFNDTATDVSIVGNVIDTGSGSASYGVNMVSGCDGLLVSGNQFTNVAVAAVNLSNSGGVSYNDVRVTNNIYRNCGEHLRGIGYTDSTSVVADNQPAMTSTATAAGTTTLTVESREVQLFTGSTTQTVALPTTRVGRGQRWTVINASTGAVTVTASGGATVATLVGGASGTFTALQGTPTAGSHWSYDLAHSDSAGTADALSVSRNISGVAFDGSADIDVVTAATVGQNYFSPGYASGNYYLCNSTTTWATSAVLGNGTVRVTPWIVTASITVTKLFAEFTVAGDAASVFRVGIWEHNASTGKPGSLVLDAGTISTGTGDAGTVATGGTPGVYEITVSQALSPGVYWVGGAVQGVSSTQPTMRTAVATVIPLFFPFGTALPSAGATTGGFALTGQTGALGTGSWVTSGSAGARIGFKVS